MLKRKAGLWNQCYQSLTISLNRELRSFVSEVIGRNAVENSYNFEHNTDCLYKLLHQSNSPEIHITEEELINGASLASILVR